MAHNILGFINRLKKDVNNLIRGRAKKIRERNSLTNFFRPPATRLAAEAAKDHSLASVDDGCRLVRRERRGLAEERGEDPAVVVIYTVVGDD